MIFMQIFTKKHNQTDFNYQNTSIFSLYDINTSDNQFKQSPTDRSWKSIDIFWPTGTTISVTQQYEMWRDKTMRLPWEFLWLPYHQVLTSQSVCGVNVNSSIFLPMALISNVYYWQLDWIGAIWLTDSKTAIKSYNTFEQDNCRNCRLLSYTATSSDIYLYSTDLRNEFVLYRSRDVARLFRPAGTRKIDCHNYSNS